MTTTHPLPTRSWQSGSTVAATCLRSLAGEEEGRVLMVVKDSPEFFYVFWGAIKAGLTPVPLNTLLRADDYRYIVEDSLCCGLVYSPEYQPELTKALAASGHQPNFILSTDGPSSLSEMMEETSPQLDPAPATPDAECFWLYSSGSTGRPKGAVHRHRDIVTTCVHYAVDTLGITEDDICFSAAKLFFAYGLGNAMTFPLWVGASAVLSGQRPSPGMTFDIIEKHRPTLYFGVPTLYAAQLRALDEQERDLIVGPLLRIGRRGVARRYFPPLAGTDRDPDPRRHRLHGSAAHLHRQLSPRLPPRLLRKTGAGLRNGDTGRGGPTGSRRKHRGG